MNLKNVKIADLQLDLENVRFTGDRANSQKEAMQLLLEDPDDAKKLVTLAQDIGRNGLSPIDLLLAYFDDNDRPIIIEGNRRTTALKLLATPSACPNKDLYPKFLKASKDFAVNLPKTVAVSIVPSKDEGERWLLLKHDGQNNGAGTLSWSTEAKRALRYKQTGKESIGRQLKKLVVANKELFDSSVIDGLDALHLTILDRLFGSSHSKRNLGIHISGGKLALLYPLESIAPALNFLLDYFTTHGYSTKDVHSDEDRASLFSTIPDDLKVDTSTVLPSPLYPLIVKQEKQNDNHVKEESEDILEQNNIQKDNAIKGKESKSPVKSQSDPNKRKRLIDWSLKISNNPHLNTLYLELKNKLNVNEQPYACAVSFRVLLEISSDCYIKRLQSEGAPLMKNSSKEYSTGDKLSAKVLGIANDLEQKGKLNKGEGKVVRSRANSQDTIGSIDYFNMFIHGAPGSPISRELNAVALEYKPYLEAIWNK